MTERHALLDAILVRGMHARRTAQGAAAFRTLRLQQMPFTCARAQHFAARRYLEAFRCRFLRLNAFGTSHKLFSSKRARNIRTQHARSKGYFPGKREIDVKQISSEASLCRKNAAFLGVVERLIHEAANFVMRLVSKSLKQKKC